MKKRVSKSIAFILMMSLLPGVGALAEDTTSYINLTSQFNADLFIKSGAGVNKENLVDSSYYGNGELWYYDGDKYADTVEINTVTYKLYGDMASKKNDVIKIDTSDVTIPVEAYATKNLGIMMFSRETESKELTVTLNYTGGKSDNYTATVNPMSYNNGTAANNPLNIVYASRRYTPTVVDGESVYLQTAFIDASKSANRSLNLQSVTFAGKDFPYYIAAITQEKYLQDDIEEQTKEIVQNCFNKYKDMTFLGVANGENDTSLIELNELYSSMLRQQGKMAETTEENILKIKKLFDSTILYVEIKGYTSEIENVAVLYADIPTDFSELSQTSLTQTDYTTLESAISAYENYDSADIDTMNGYISDYGLESTVSVSVDEAAREHIYALYDAYTKAKLKSDLKADIELYYNDYISKDISEITESDFEALGKMIAAFDKALEAGISLDEYNCEYIRHLYNDIEAYKTSEDCIMMDISDKFNVDALMPLGSILDKVPLHSSQSNEASTLYGSVYTPLWTADTLINTAISGYAESTYSGGVRNVTEYQYIINEEESTEEVKFYSYVKTDDIIPFDTKESRLEQGVKDAIELVPGEAVTITASGASLKKLYFIGEGLGTEVEIAIRVTYSDGSITETPVKMSLTSTWIYNAKSNVQSKKYPARCGGAFNNSWKTFCYVKDSETGKYVVTEKSSQYPGFSMYSVELDASKVPVSYEFVAADNYDALIYAITESPASNDVIVEGAMESYNAVVEDGKIVSDNVADIAKAVLSYNEAARRGLYVAGVDKNIIELLAARVLMVSVTAARYDKETVKARIDFSNPVDAASATSAVSVMSEGDKTPEVRVAINEEQTEMSLDIAVSRDEEKLSINIADTLFLKAYPEIKLLNPITYKVDVPEYITAEYKENNQIIINNNSQVDQKYIAFVTASNEDGVVVKTATGTVIAGDTKTEMIDMSSYSDRVIKAGVMDADTYAPLVEISEVKKTEDETDSSADYTVPGFDFVKNVLNIKGFTKSGKANKIVTVFVRASASGVIYAGEVRTNSDGYFSFEIPVNDEVIPVSGNVEVIIGGEDFETAYINQVYYPVLSDRVSIINDLKNAADDNAVAALLDDVGNNLSLNFAPFIACLDSAMAKQKLAKRIYDEKNKISSVSVSDTTEETNKKTQDVQKLIKQLSVLVCISTNNTDAVSDGIELLYNDVMNYDSIDNDGVTLYELYRKEISDVGKKNILSGMSGKNYNNKDEYFKELKKLIMLNLLKYPKNKGAAYISKALTAKNAQATDMDITKYLNLKDNSEVSSHIANMTVNSLEDVEKYISSIETEKTKQSNKGSSGGSGASVGVVTAFPVANQEALKEENDKNNAEKNEANKKKGFDDVKTSHWAYKAIGELVSKGIINGRSEKTFAPDEKITRAEFVKLLCVAKSLEITDVLNDKFSDVNVNDWYAPYVAAACKAGIINGISEQEFGASLPITRQDICTVLYRMSGINEESEPTFTDSDEISDYAKFAVAYFNSIGVINGFEDNTFRPAASATRAQAALILYNYLGLAE